jgi:hypothetical protein
VHGALKVTKNDKNNNNDNKNGRYCGLSTSQSEDYWWMGVQPCMGANKMYSLYGILTSETSFMPKIEINVVKGEISTLSILQRFRNLHHDDGVDHILL